MEYLDDAIQRARRAAEGAGVGDRVELVHGDVLQIDPEPFDVVHMHLGPAFHDVLAARLERLLQPRARVVAAGWRVPGWQPVADALEQWDGGSVYRPADPRMHATWGARDDAAGWIELNVHADLRDIEPRLDDVPAGDRIAVSHADAGRGTTILMSLPADPEARLSIWARCRAERFTQRGTMISTGAGAERVSPEHPDL